MGLKTYRIFFFPLILCVLLTSQLNAQEAADPFKTTFLGKWKLTKTYCRTVENGHYKDQRLTNIIPANDVFIPDVEISFKEEMLKPKDGTIVPTKNVEKAVTQNSCLLPKPEISTMNSQQGGASGFSNPNYIWSKNQVQIVHSQTINGVQYYKLSGHLIDKKIDYKALRNCGNKIQTTFGAWTGIIGTLLTYYRYDFGESYSNVEANRNYTISVRDNVLSLEFFESEICAGANERVVMVFKKNP